VPARHADRFVRRDHVIALAPTEPVELMTREQVMADPELSPQSPITVVREIEQVETATPETLIALVEGDLARTVRVLAGERIEETPVRDVLARMSRDPEQPVSIVRQVEYYQKTSPEELGADESFSAGSPLRVIRRAQGPRSTTVGELLTGEQGLTADTVFYVRTIGKADKQGIWGIVHHGLIDNFAQGIAIRRGQQVDTYQVAIPRDADEMQADRSSSFLGRLIYQKTQDSYVYNFQRRRMGRNPDLLSPGQEIVIIRFTDDELISIYKHFVASRT